MAMGNIDKEDSENEDKFDNYEQKFNFRFEEQGGINITTHTRDMDTYREKDDTRIVKRKERDLRIKKEKEEMKKELKKAQEIKKSEIMEKVNRLERIAGTDKIKLLAEELDNEYNPDKFDSIMNKVFNDEFYNEKDKNAENIVEDIDEKKPDFYTNAKLEFIENEEEEEGDEEEGDGNGVKIKKKVRHNHDDEYQQEEEHEEYDNYGDEDEPYDENEEENEWWYCDGKTYTITIF